MELFDLTKILFDRNSDWSKVSMKDKSSHFFMVNRFMSINFPMQANILNRKQINPVVGMDIWRSTMTRLYTKPPFWIYTKTNKKKKKTASLSDFEITRWMRLMGVSKKDIDFAMELFSNEIEKEIRSLEFEEK